MRVLMLADRLSARGGADWHMLGVVEALLAQHGVELAVERVDGTAEVGCRVHHVPGLGARERSPVDLDGLVEVVRPDVIHVHNVVNPEVLHWAVGRRALLTIQDHRFFCPGRGKLTASGEICETPMGADVCAGCFDDVGYFERILALTMDRIAAARQLPVVVLSDYMRGELCRVGLAPGSVHVIPPFAWGLDRDAAPDGPPCVLFVGRLVAAKGVADAISAWRASALGLPLVMAGTGSRREQAERETGVQVLGWVSHERLSALYRRAQVVLFPARWQEPFGIVGLEALTMGTPVAAFRSGGVPQWHPGEGLVDWGDVDGLARAAAELAGQTVTAPPGFEREALMERLVGLYAMLAA
jgi:glycosyltransferase involved in cell wall biosynthesis